MKKVLTKNSRPRISSQTMISKRSSIWLALRMETMQNRWLGRTWQICQYPKSSIQMQQKLVYIPYLQKPPVNRIPMMKVLTSLEDLAEQLLQKLHATTATWTRTRAIVPIENIIRGQIRTVTVPLEATIPRPLHLRNPFLNSERVIVPPTVWIFLKAKKFGKLKASKVQKTIILQNIKKVENVASKRSAQIKIPKRPSLLVWTFSNFGKKKKIKSNDSTLSESLTSEDKNSKWDPSLNKNISVFKESNSMQFCQLNLTPEGGINNDKEHYKNKTESKSKYENDDKQPKTFLLKMTKRQTIKIDTRKIPGIIF